MEKNRWTGADANRKVSEVLNVGNHRVDRHHWLQVAGTDISSGHDDVARGDSLNHFLRSHVISPQTIWIYIDHDRSGISAEGWWGGNSWKRCKERTNAVQRKILNLSQASRLTGKHKEPDRYAPCVETHHKRGNGSCRHERTCPIDVGNCLSQSLAHVCARMESELEQPHVLD